MSISASHIIIHYINPPKKQTFFFFTALGEKDSFWCCAWKSSLSRLQSQISPFREKVCVDLGHSRWAASQKPGKSISLCRTHLTYKKSFSEDGRISRWWWWRRRIYCTTHHTDTEFSSSDPGKKIKIKRSNIQHWNALRTETRGSQRESSRLWFVMNAWSTFSVHTHFFLFLNNTRVSVPQAFFFCKIPRENACDWPFLFPLPNRWLRNRSYKMFFRLFFFKC